MNFVYGICMTIAGAICFIVGRSTFKTARASKKWPPVQGKVVESGTMRMSGIEGVATAASVKYTYQVDGREYVSSRISMGQYGTGGGEHAKAEAAKYPAGKIVTVHYDPKNPAQAVLEPGGALFLSLFLFFFAAVTFFAGLLFLLAAFL